MQENNLEKEIRTLGFNVNYLGIKNRIYNFKNADERFSIKIYHIEEPESLTTKQKEVIKKSGKYIRLSDKDNVILSDYFDQKTENDIIIQVAISYMIYGNRYTKELKKENNQNDIIDILNKREIFLPEFENKSLTEIYEKLSFKSERNFTTTEKFINDEYKKPILEEKSSPEEYAIQENKFPKIGNLM